MNEEWKKGLTAIGGLIAIVQEIRPLLMSSTLRKLPNKLESMPLVSKICGTCLSMPNALRKARVRETRWSDVEDSVWVCEAEEEAFDAISVSYTNTTLLYFQTV